MTSKKKKGGFLQNYRKYFKIPFIGSVSNLNVALSIRHLSLMLRSGLSLGDAVEVLAEQTSDKKLRRVFERIYDNIQMGKNLSDSMREEYVFSDVIVSIVSAGEQGGTLEKNLIFLADYLKKSHALSKKIKGALMYPGIVFALALTELLGIVFFILPNIESLFEGFDVPPLTQAIMDGSKYFRDNSAWFALGFVLFLFMFSVFLSTKAGKAFKDRFALSFPVIKNLTKNNIISTFSRTLHILLESGVPIASALEISEKAVGNGIYSRILGEISESVREGQTIASAMEKHKKYFPSTYAKMIEVGEETGALEENLFYLHEYHAEEVDDITSNLTILLEPIMLIFIGGMIGFVAFMVISPIYQFTGSING